MFAWATRIACTDCIQRGTNSASVWPNSADQRYVFNHVSAAENFSRSYARIAALRSIALCGAQPSRCAVACTAASRAAFGGFSASASGIAWGCATSRATAKPMVIRQCIKMGWPVSDDNEADALAIWHYQCSLLAPKLALMPTPLFGC